MKVKLILIASVILMTGCYQNTSNWDIERATLICNGVENIVQIRVDMNGNESVLCRNGQFIGLGEAKYD